MNRRFWFAQLAQMLGASFTLLGRLGRADEQQTSLNETLRSVLKCRRPEEFAFVDLVVLKVDQGKLPRSLVLSMMDWATRRSREEVAAGRRESDFPFPYFQEGLRIRAAEINVKLPAFKPNVTP